MKVTLSFDNGPTAAVTSHVLDTLAQHRAKATFFLVAENLTNPANRAVAERAAEEGHWIGNHTLTHSTQLGDSDDPHLAEREIGQAQQLIGDLASRDLLFRPYGRGGVLDRRLLSRPSLTYLQQHAYTCVLWNCVPRDWEQPDTWVDRCLADLTTRDWSLVVLHDLPTGAMRHLPRFLDSLTELGADLVQDFPPDCVPIRQGHLHRPIGHLLAR
ncbi:polysaccharide deacetylase family protein [Streptomyces alboflavus]|uniref:polysaccharide deacetylase family protein n=1 Tax=Streptomyces alboflavus TaxID=67267 RepID=UPI0004C04545|nr:polysaccharide deacetylase family protein [Streptomyces alboflavus]